MLIQVTKPCQAVGTQKQQGVVGTGVEKSQSTRGGHALLIFALTVTVYPKAKISNYAHCHQDTGLTELSVV